MQSISVRVSLSTQVAKWRLNVSGVIKAGPLRPPYYDLPDDWKEQVELEVAGFQALREKYMTTDQL